MELVIVGAGGHGREVLDVVEAVDSKSEKVRFLGFLDDGEVHEERLAARSSRHLGTVQWLKDNDAAYILGIGSSEARRGLARQISEWSRPAISLIHPGATLGSKISIGPGVLVAAGAHLTTNIDIGEHTHINIACVVSHDSSVGEFTTLSPGVIINGDCTVGDDVFLGSGAIVTRGVTVGNGASVGAGAVVLSDVEPGQTVVGAPARPTK